MKIQPVASPSAIQQPPSNAAALKANAIAAFNKASQPASQQPEQPIVQNQNSISPEEMSAVKAPTGQPDSIVDKTLQASEVIEETPAVEEKPVDPALSRQFAQLARQEKALRAKAQQQEQQFRAREEALKAKEAAISSEPKTDMSNYIEKSRFKSDPLSVLAETGLSYDEIVQQLINQPTIDPRLEATINGLKSEIQALRAQDEARTKSAQEQQTQAYQAAVKQIENDAKALVRKDPAYETIRVTNSVKDVVDLIEQTYQKDGVLLTVEEAAQQVEDYLVEEAFKLTKIDKIKKKLQQVAPAQPASEVQTPSPEPVKQPQTMKTLTNATSSSRQLSAKERAILAFKGQLKS